MMVELTANFHGGEAGVLTLAFGVDDGVGVDSLISARRMWLMMAEFQDSVRACS